MNKYVIIALAAAALCGCDQEAAPKAASGPGVDVLGTWQQVQADSQRQSEIDAQAAATRAGLAVQASIAESAGRSAKAQEQAAEAQQRLAAEARRAADDEALKRQIREERRILGY